MVAHDPVERPGSLDYIVNQLTALRQQIDTLTRQSKYPFSVSHNGIADFQIIPDPGDPNGNARVVIGNGSGGTVFETFYSTLYGGKVARFYDLAANLMWNQDELAGYGISHPSLQGFLGPDFYGQGSSSFGTGVETAVAYGEFFAYNPAFRFSSLVRSGGSAFSWRYSIDYPGGTVYGPLTTGATGSVYAASTLLLPEPAMSVRVVARLLVTNTAAAQTMQVSPQACYGVSMAQYKLDNNLP